MNDRAFGDNSNVCSAGANVYNCRSAFIASIDAGAECRRQTFLHHIHFADMSFFCRVHQRALLNVRDFAEHTHHSLQGHLRTAAF